MAKLLPEQVMLRWVNHHIRTYTATKAFLATPEDQRPIPADYAVANLADDLKDGKALSVVLHQVAPKHTPCDLGALGAATSAAERAAKVVDDARRIGVRRFAVTPSDITAPRQPTTGVASTWRMVQP